MSGLPLMSKVIIITELSEKDLPNHYDVYSAILKRDICNYVSNLQFVINFKSHHTTLSAMKLLSLHDTNGIQGLLMCPNNKVATRVTTNDRYTSHINSPSFQDTCST